MTLAARMERFGGIADKLDKFFLAFLFINPFLDIVNGIFIFYLQENLKGQDMPITFSLIVRMCFLLVMGAYLLLRWDWKGLWTVLPAAGAAVLSILSVYFFADRYNTFLDFQYAAKFLFNLLAMAVYSQALLRRGAVTRQEAMRRLEKVFVFSAAAFGLTILASFLFGVGLFTYENRFGLTGTRAYFFSGNEITAGMIACLPFCFKSFLSIPFSEYRRPKNWGYLLTPGILASALILIGTKTSFMGLALVIAAFVLFGVIELVRKNPGFLLRVGAVLAVIAAFFGLLQLVSGAKLLDNVKESVSIIEDQKDRFGNETQEYIIWYNETHDITYEDAVAKTNKWVHILLSGREFFLMDTAEIWAQSPPPVWFAGIGRSAVRHTIEMDLCEVFFYYGIIGFFLMLWPYSRRLFRVLGRFFKKWDLAGFTAVASIAIVTVYMIMAGHVLFTVTAGFYFALTIVYASLNYGVLLPEFAKDEEAAAIDC